MLSEKGILSEKLLERNLPDLLAGTDAVSWKERRSEILDLFSREMYGYTPKFETELYSYVEEKKDVVMSGQASRERIRLSFMTPGGMYSFPFTLLLPKQGQPVPAFVHLNFSWPNDGAEILPKEMILEEGFAVAILQYNEVTSDSWEWDGLARAYTASKEENSHWGKIGMWAFAASRVMDYLLTRPEIDGSRIAVIGHSRLGKTALWSAAQDERFSMAISNDFGCGGAALHRGKVGEQVDDITRVFPYWFCKNYQKYKKQEHALPFDQHMLLACIAPRALYVASAQEDIWADPVSEYLGLAAASEVWEMLGERGLISQKELPDVPNVNMALTDGKAAYRLREGMHYMGRSDWEAYIQYRKLHGV